MGFNGTQQRLFVISSLNSGDSVLIEGTPDYYSSKGQANAAPTAVTITATMSALNPYVVVEGPWTAVRVHKLGTNAAAVVKAVI